jgi:hypothetical protein
MRAVEDPSAHPLQWEVGREREKEKDGILAIFPSPLPLLLIPKHSPRPTRPENIE